MVDPGRAARADIATLFDTLDDLIERPALASDRSGRVDSREGHSDPARRFRADAERALDLAFDALADLGELIGDVWKGVTQRSGGDELVLGPLRPGAGIRSSFWIHNTSATLTSDLTPMLTSLVRQEGRRLETSDLAFDPDEAGPVAAGASLEMTMHFEVPPDTPPGRYFGSLLVSGLPLVRLPVSVVVEP